MSADRREFVRVSVDLPTHPKLAELDDPAAGWAVVVAFCYCGRHLTDGEFPLGPVLREAGVEKDKAEALVGVGMWHLHGHDCPDCPQPREGKAQIHDYLQHQRSRAEAEAMRAKKSAAGTKGAETRWGSRRDSKPVAPAMAPAMPSAIANGWHSDSKPDSKPIAEVEGEVEVTEPPSGGSADAPAPAVENVNQQAQRITRAYHDREPMSKFPAVMQIVKKAINSGRYDGEQITAALLRLADEGRSVTVDSLRTELDGFPASRNGHQSYRNPDPSEYHQPAKGTR